MKIIYISHWRFPSEKTMSPLIMRTCEEIARLGSNIELWVPTRRISGGTFIFKGEYPFKIRRLRILDTIDIAGVFGFIVMVALFNVAVWMKARREKPETIYFAHDFRDSLLLFVSGRHVILEIHDFYRSSIELINKFAFKRAIGFVVTNRIKMKTLSEIYGISAEKMIHLPNAVDVEQFSPYETREEAREKLNLPQEQSIILYTGHLFDWKGVDTLLLAASYLPDMRVYFVGGTDTDIADFKKKAEMLGVCNVVIAGRKPHLEIPLWQRAADVLVLPNTAKVAASKYETSPVKLFEYMVSGTPIVASDLPSIRDIVGESEVQFFNPDDAQDLARVIQSVLKDSTLAYEKANKLSIRALQFSWDNRARSILQFINSCVANR